MLRNNLQGPVRRSDPRIEINEGVQQLFAAGETAADDQRSEPSAQFSVGESGAQLGVDKSGAQRRVERRRFLQAREDVQRLVFRQRLRRVFQPGPRRGQARQAHAGGENERAVQADAGRADQADGPPYDLQARGGREPHQPARRLCHACIFQAVAHQLMSESRVEFNLLLPSVLLFHVSQRVAAS